MQSRQDDLSLREQMIALNISSAQWIEERGIEQLGVKIYFLWPLGVFFRVYVQQGGWRQGTRGLIAAVIGMYGAFVSAAKLWEKWWIERRAAELK